MQSYPALSAGSRPRRQSAMAIAQMPAVSQRLWRPSARPMASTVSGASSRPLRVIASERSSSATLRAAMPGRPATILPRSPAPLTTPSMRPTGPRLRSIHSRTTGSAVVQMSSFGSKRARDALDHHHGLLQQQQLRPRLHVEQARDLEQQGQQLRHGNFLGGALVDRLADGADRLREVFDRMVRRHVAGLEVHFGDAQIVAGDEAVENLGEEAPFLQRRAGP